MKTYIDPSVKLIDNTATDLSFFLWMKSRQWVITDLKGNRFMTKMESPKGRYPSQFYVGKELVNCDEYIDRINKMNLQYNNFDNYVFEINGSCLFRDILYTINKCPMWAQSNRFLFSILQEDAIYDESNYHISSEYREIPEWEEQFDVYMNAIKVDQIVDHNRLEMPYSISSTFWIAINKKTLLDLLAFLKNEAPFFYNIYGVKFVSALRLEGNLISESDIPEKPSAAITQYIRKSEWEGEKCTTIGDTIVLDCQMGLILYSQFIRQADTKISGFFNEVMHSDAESFSHIVFKGGTVFPIQYVADIDKVKSTISTRLCAFAMSSGDGPCSWNYFISKFIDKMNEKEFMEILPCKFKNYKVVDCPFKDDVKFRNDGTEVSNCPCPLITRSMSDAKAKRDRDNNLIGSMFYNLTEYLLDEGLRLVYDERFWTSNLVIYIDIYDSVGDLYKFVRNIITEVESSLPTKHHPDLKVNPSYDKIEEIVEPYILENDFTCIMKGLAIDRIKDVLESQNVSRYLISFGNDIYIKNIRTSINIEGTKFNIQTAVDKCYSIFTSGNTDKRGNHIIGCNEGETSTVIVDSDNAQYVNILTDLLATKSAANEDKNVFGVKMALYQFGVDKITILKFNNGKLKSPTYCASPFFNPEQVAIRDAMVSEIVDPFRPDLTDSEAEYGGKKDDNSVSKVVEDNIKGIEITKFLVFPANTSDLGTLVEVGTALELGHSVIRYDEVKRTYTLITDWDQVTKWHALISSKLTSPFEKLIFDCSDKRNAVLFGMASMMFPNEKVCYTLNGSKDNIMLSVFHTHYELGENGNYKIVIRDESDRDK